MMGIGLAMLAIATFAVSVYAQSNPAPTPAVYSSAPPAVVALVPNTPVKFDGVRARLKKLTKVPLRLPTYVPMHGQVTPQPGTTPESLPVFASLTGTNSANKYEVTLGYTSDCTGGNACRLGTVAGRVKPNEPLERPYGFMNDPNYIGRRSQEKMAPVALSKGLRGLFVPWICGANCNDAKVTWDENGYRYWVGIKVGDKASLVKMANSAIGSGGR